ncbi:MAG: aldehyde dehydrogenase family protein [Chloroflexi bacterium]|nr:aldehyde dehydrogenase family protein [Chloroflexota bacterium]
MTIKGYKNLIGGKWVESSTGATFETRNPAAVDEVLGVFPMASPLDASNAIAAAQEAFCAWANTPPPNRGAILDRASQLIAARLEDLAITLTREEGKTLAEARGEVARARDIFRYYAGEGWRSDGSVLPSNTSNELLYTRREPLGVVSIIAPWNFPIAIPAWKIAPALVYGNAVVFKPASFTPLVGLRLVEILVEAGLPAGVINFVTGSGRDAGNELVANPQVNAISFTGSNTVGTGIYSQAVRNMARVQLEMGGKNPTVVLNDANLDLALDIVMKAGFGLTGQACTATSRVIVESGIADEFSARLSAAAKSLVVGDGTDEKTQMGPAVSQGQLDTDLGFVKIGKEEGARLVTGGERLKGPGYYVEPTVFDHVGPQMRIAQEEIFGPVISILRAANFEDALRLANGIGFGLSAAIMTRDLAKAFEFANRVDAGVVKINEPTTGLALQAPFGGFKHSSANTFKEQGQAAAEFYTRTKTVYVAHG